MLKSLSFCKLVYLSLLISLTSIHANAQTTATHNRSVDNFIKDPSIWQTTQQQIADTRPHLDWKKSKEPNNFHCWRKDMLLWDQSVRKLVLTLNPDTLKTQAICYSVITEKQATEMTKEEIIKDIIKWRALIDKKLQTKSIQLPATKSSSGRDIASIAWLTKNYIITFAVFSEESIIHVDLTFHEPKSGLKTIGLEQEVEEIDP